MANYIENTQFPIKIKFGFDFNHYLFYTIGSNYFIPRGA